MSCAHFQCTCVVQEARDYKYNCWSSFFFIFCFYWCGRKPDVQWRSWVVQLCTKLGKASKVKQGGLGLGKVPVPWYLLVWIPDWYVIENTTTPVKVCSFQQKVNASKCSAEEFSLFFGITPCFHSSNTMFCRYLVLLYVWNNGEKMSKNEIVVSQFLFFPRD